MTETNFERGEERTLSGIPTTVQTDCPVCHGRHTFELFRENIVPSALQDEDKTMNDAAPVYRAKCAKSEYGIIQTCDILMERDFKND